MKKYFALFTLIFCAVSLSADNLKVPVENLNKLMIEPYRHFSVEASYGLRSLAAPDANTLLLEIGMSCANIFDSKEAYYIVSFDDENYSPSLLRQPEIVNIKRIEEAKSLPANKFKSFNRTRVVLKVPVPMKKGCSYSVTAVPIDSMIMTAGRDGVSCVFTPDKKSDDDKLKEEINLKILGLRGIESLGNGCIQLSFGPAIAPNDINYGSKITFTLNGKAIKPQMLIARNTVESYVPDGQEMIPIYRTDLFFQLENILNDGDKIEAVVDETSCSAWNKATLDFNSKTAVSSSFHTSNYGYIAESPVKSAYIAKWMGDLTQSAMGDSPGDEPALVFEKPPRYTVVNQTTGESVLTSETTLVSDPRKLEAMEILDYPGEAVYLADLSKITKKGWYFIYVEGIGRSLPFKISDESFVNDMFIPSHKWFDSVLDGKIQPPPTIRYGLPWYTNLWKTNPDAATKNALPASTAQETKNIEQASLKKIVPARHIISMTPSEIKKKEKLPWYTTFWNYTTHELDPVNIWSNLTDE